MSGGKADFLFRKVALDRLRSPEQLDKAIAITTPRDWVALAAAGTITLLFLIWSFVGGIPTRVEGQGILISAGGQVTDAVAVASGTLTNRGLHEGESVRQGQPIAGVAVPSLAQRASDSRDQLAATTRIGEEARAERRLIARSRAETLAAQQRAVEIAIAAGEQRTAAYAKQLESQRAIAERGFATRTSVQQTEEQLAAAQQAVAEARGRLAALRADQTALGGADARDEADQRQRELAARQSSAGLASELRQSDTVTSPANGRIVEWKAAFGTYVGAGTPIASIASGSGDLGFTLFLPVADGKRVAPGMDVRIELAGLPREQWGTLAGHVVSVSSFPVTREGMLAIVRNEALVNTLSAGGAPFLVRIALDRAPGTPTGFRWTGGSGPDTALSAGATGTARVTVQYRRPITYLLGFVRKALGA